MPQRWWTVSTFLSFSRAPLALLILINYPWWRVSVMALIALTDILDGYLARKTNSTTSFGAFIDPVMDRLVIIFILVAYLLEKKLNGLEMATFLCRDLVLSIFWILMQWKGYVGKFKLRGIYTGKAVTSYTFVLLMGLTFNISFPWYYYAFFIPLALGYAYELYYSVEDFKKRRLVRLLPFRAIVSRSNKS